MAIKETACSLLLAATVILVGATDPEARPCPITSVGKSYRMVCSGKTKTSSRFVLWDREEPVNHTKSDISRCYFNDPCTILMDASRYTVSNTPNGNTFESILTILKVSHEDVGVTILCKAMDANPTNPSDPSIISTCQLPVFSLAQPPTCRATPIGPDVRIDCSFPKVHPKLTCRLGYYPGSFERESSIEYVEKTLTPSTPLYNSMDCTGFLKVKNQSQTKYYVKVLPNFNRELSEEALELHATVLEVNLPSSPKVLINMPRYIPICPLHKNHTVTLHCSATTATQNPTFHFYVTDAEVRQEKSSVYKMGEMYSTLQEYRITLDESFQDKVLRCKIDEWHYDTAVISLAKPPTRPPQFMSAGSILNHFYMNQSENLSAMCIVADGTPLVSNISVTCVSPNGTKITRAKNISNVVYFTIVGLDTGHGSKCYCTAYHVSGCYNATGWLRIFHSGQKEEHVTNDEVHTYLLYVVFGLIVIPVLVATCLFAYRNRDKLYSGHKPKPPSNLNDNIDSTERKPKQKRRKFSHSKSSKSVNSDYLSRYRDHIELHRLETDGGKNVPDDTPGAPTPPSCNLHGNNNKVNQEFPRTTSKSDSQYETHIPAFPSRNKSASSYEEDDSQPGRPNKPKYDGNGNHLNHDTRRGGRPSSPRTRVGNYRNISSSYDSSYRGSVEENPDDDIYVNPVTPFSSEESLSRNQSPGRGDRRPWEEKALYDEEARSNEPARKKEETRIKEEVRREEEARKEDEARREEEVYLLKLIDHNDVSYDEDFSSHFCNDISYDEEIS